MHTEVCPQCLGNKVVAFQILHNLNGRLLTPPEAMWACLTPTCLYKWPRQSLKRTA
jgi:hypothetical protein